MSPNMRFANMVITGILGLISLVAWGYAAVRAIDGWIPPSYLVVSGAITACALTGWILVFIGEQRRDEHTRCRKCNHILRGLTEPRCPECGTDI